LVLRQPTSPENVVEASQAVGHFHGLLDLGSRKCKDGCIRACRRRQPGEFGLETPETRASCSYIMLRDQGLSASCYSVREISRQQCCLTQCRPCMPAWLPQHAVHGASRVCLSHTARTLLPLPRLLIATALQNSWAANVQRGHVHIHACMTKQYTIGLEYSSEVPARQTTTTQPQSYAPHTHSQLLHAWSAGAQTSPQCPPPVAFSSSTYTELPNPSSSPNRRPTCTCMAAACM
jgi:hypothetical protein